MPAFTIGVHNLPAAEVILIKTLIRLFSHDAGFRWRFAEAGPYDAVIVDGTREAPRPPSGLARVTLTITGASATPEPDTLSRPIRAEQLQAWLAQQAQALLTMPRLHRTDGKCTPGRSGLRFKLRRWPSAALLGNDPQRIRLATLLSRRALGARELSALSKLPHEQCVAFVNALHQAGLVEVQEVANGSRTRTVSAPLAPQDDPALGMGLISSLRRRLGL